MPHQAGPASNAAPLDVNVTILSNHVLVYDLYWRDDSPNSAWQLLGRGDTGDNSPDHYQIPGPKVKGSQIWYSFGIGNPAKPKTAYSCLLTLGQNGKILSGGTIAETGITNAAGNAFVEDWVTVL